MPQRSDLEELHKYHLKSYSYLANAKKKLVTGTTIRCIDKKSKRLLKAGRVSRVTDVYAEVTQFGNSLYLYWDKYYFYQKSPKIKRSTQSAILRELLEKL